jgi:DNA-binding response OmpR family regulator
MIEDKTQAFNLGGDDYITKPFRIEELIIAHQCPAKKNRHHR